jgi:hypothetical protein
MTWPSAADLIDTTMDACARPAVAGDVFFVLSALLVFLPGCGDIATSAEDPDADVERWVAQAELHIGAADGPGPLLTRVGAVRIAGDGRLVVSQPQDREILVFDGGGELLAVAGGAGEGPGELGSVAGLGLDGDSIFVADNSRRGLSFFSLDGEFLSARVWMLDAEQEITPDGAMHFPAPPQVLLDDGTALVRPGYGYAFPQEDEGRQRYRWPLLRIGPAGQALDTLGHYELEISWIRMAGLPGPGMLWGPFSDHPLVELAPDGAGAVFVRRPIAADAGINRFVVGRLDPRGDTVGVASFPYRPVPIPEVRLRRYAQEQASRGGDDASPLSPADVERALRRAGMVPPFLPPVSRIVPTSDGSIWLQREDTGADTVSWDVLDPALDRRRRVVFPAGFTVHDAAGNVVVGVELDAFDVPRVARYRLAAGGG